MQTTVITIPSDQITDWNSFHSIFQVALGFPEFYGRNMDAWIDCMTYVDDPSSGLTRVSIRPGELLALRIDDASDFERRSSTVSGSDRVYCVCELSAGKRRRISGACADT